MTLLRVVLSDLHLGTGTRRGQLNPLEDFIHDDRLVELLAYYDRLAGSDGSIELILNGDIFDLLKVKIADEWPTEVTEDIAIAKLQQCLEGHPKFVLALREFQVIDEAELGRRIVRASNRCILDLRGRPLLRSSGRGGFDRLYSCGAVIQFLADRAILRST